MPRGRRWRNPGLPAGGDGYDGWHALAMPGMWKQPVSGGPDRYRTVGFPPVPSL
jgi:hypothetical protein